MAQPVNALSRREPVPTAAPSDRRQHHRLSGGGLDWLQIARVKYGPEIRILDLSAGGMMIETGNELVRGSRMVFELVGTTSSILMPSRVLRCRPAPGDEPARRRFRSACSFARRLPLTDLGNNRSDTTESAGVPQRVERIVLAMEEGAGSRTAVAADSRLGWQRVIARYRDGRMLRGFTNTFHASRSQLQISEDPVADAGMFVPLAQLKAVFFVRQFEGDPLYIERKTFHGPSNGRRVELTFHDDEILIGSTLSYRQDGHGFFVYPADPASNNLRVFAVSSAIRHVRFL